MKKKIIKKSQEEIPFAPVDSKITIDLSPRTFKNSDEFSKRMDRAHRRAIRQNLAYGQLRQR